MISSSFAYHISTFDHGTPSIVLSVLSTLVLVDCTIYHRFICQHSKCIKYQNKTAVRSLQSSSYRNSVRSTDRASDDRMLLHTPQYPITPYYILSTSLLYHDASTATHCHHHHHHQNVETWKFAARFDVSAAATNHGDVSSRGCWSMSHDHHHHYRHGEYRYVEHYYR